ncbi:phosphate ABC transporter substrate-binding protein [candidate division NPL-UPA2 bacterium Unc8]|uniref:Phosphate ABC transporter substrate-binding protein n=1 Tax=candidate division NPL-UPA2 bacterium Unc8 TaxID=1980939 RepID=A0A399FTV9_UNCN2|nr:MAG: phosphate ABC transporter substrate-binding protein [candidate division NPL-UPA2 bacterium Unc8]
MKKGMWIPIGIVVLVAIGIGVIIRAVAPQVPPPPLPAVTPQVPLPPLPAGRIVVGGSSSVYVVAVHLAERFMDKHPGVVVETHSVGSTAGIVGAREGTFHIGMASRWLRRDEPGWGLREFVICHDAIAPIVHPNNPVRGLTMKQLKKIFTGEITNWNKVGGENLPITVIIREAGSGTRDAFEEIVHEGIDPVPTLILVGTGGVRAGVAGDPSSISYVASPAVDPTVRALEIDGVKPDAAAVVAGDWAIARPFLFLTMGELSPLEQGFIDFVLGSEGQQMVADEGLVRVD